MTNPTIYIIGYEISKNEGHGEGSSSHVCICKRAGFFYGPETAGEWLSKNEVGYFEGTLKVIQLETFQ